MNIKPLHTEENYYNALDRVESLMNASYGSKEGDELEVLSTLIEDYEEKHFPIDPADPVEAIKFRMEQGTVTKEDLEKYLHCTRGRVSEILNKKRPLSLKMIRSLSKHLNIPSEVLVQEYSLNR